MLFKKYEKVHRFWLIFCFVLMIRATFSTLKNSQNLMLSTRCIRLRLKKMLFLDVITEAHCTKQEEKNKGQQYQKTVIARP